MTDRSKINPFSKALFDVEHALCMYANSYSTFPAEFLYDKEVLAPLMSVINKCHIYMIGYQPKIDFVEAKQTSSKVFVTFSILGKEYTIENTVPDGMVINPHNELFITDNQGQKYYPDASIVQSQLSRETNMVTFEVKYIGQAFGKKNSRNAVDRLLRHETLQRIALRTCLKSQSIL